MTELPFCKWKVNAMNRITADRMLANEVTVAAPDAGFALPGVDENGNLIHWPVDDGLLGGGILLLGDAGTGKSNAMGLLARQIRRALGPDEVMIAFDASGELANWSRPGDCVIGRDGWNLPQEAGEDMRTARKLARALIGDGPDPFFDEEDDAVELLARLLIQCGDTPELCAAIEAMAGEGKAARYLADWCEDHLAGRFDGPDAVSMRRFVREGGRALFVNAPAGEDMEIAACAMLSAAICQAAKESRRVYVLLDDFDRLYHLSGPAMDALVNAKNIAPVVSARTATDPEVMMGEFGTKVLFRTSDRFVREAFGDSCLVNGDSVVDMERGQAAVRCAHFAPFVFRFKKNPGRRS